MGPIKKKNLFPKFSDRNQSKRKFISSRALSILLLKRQANNQTTLYPNHVRRPSIRNSNGSATPRTTRRTKTHLRNIRLKKIFRTSKQTTLQTKRRRKQCQHRRRIPFLLTGI